LGNYFENILDEQKNIKIFIHSILQNKTLSALEKVNFQNIIGIYIRLSDLDEMYKTNIDWYEKVVKLIALNISEKHKFFYFFRRER
jgi:hypothetical protein